MGENLSDEIDRHHFYTTGHLRLKVRKRIGMIGRISPGKLDSEYCRFSIEASFHYISTLKVRALESEGGMIRNVAIKLSNKILACLQVFNSTAQQISCEILNNRLPSIASLDLNKSKEILPCKKQKKNPTVNVPNAGLKPRKGSV
jgi:hypothetical protein